MTDQEKALAPVETAGSIDSQRISMEVSNPQPFVAKSKSEDANVGSSSELNIGRRTTVLEKVSRLKLDPSRVVPVSKRRGLFVRGCLVPEYDDPREYPPAVKKMIVLVIAGVAMIGPMGTSILFPATIDAVDDLNTTSSMFNIAVGIYLITLGLVPVWWSNFSERHGRRSIYLISFFLNIVFSMGCALSKSISMLIVFRVFTGGCAASVQSVGAGTIADLYDITERGTAFGYFYLGPLMGPLLSPIIGGLIASRVEWGWRGTMWFLVILGVASFILLCVCLPETLRLQDNREAIREMLRARLKSPQPKDEEAILGDAESEASEIGRAAGATTGADTTEHDTSTPEKTTETAPTLTVSTAAAAAAAPTATPADVPTPSTITSSASSLNSTTSSTSASIDEYEVESINRMLTRLSMEPSHLDGDEVGAVPLDPNVPLSRVQTTVTFIPTKTREQRMEEEVAEAEKVKNGSFLEKARYYFKIYGWGPLKGFVFLRYPPVFFAILYSAPCFAVLYIVNISLTHCYSDAPYNFSTILVGLVYIPNSVSYMVASIWGGKFQDYLLMKKIKKYGTIEPEARFGINVYVAAFILPCSLLITGWCFEKHEHWVTPLVGTALFGFAQMIVIGVTVTYLSDCLPGRGATGVAINNFIRQMLAAICTFTTVPAIDAIGVGVLMSIGAAVVFCMISALFVLVRRGDHWRETYNLEKLYDILDS